MYVSNMSDTASKFSKSSQSDGKSSREGGSVTEDCNCYSRIPRKSPEPIQEICINQDRRILPTNSVPLQKNPQLCQCIQTDIKEKPVFKLNREVQTDETRQVSAGELIRFNLVRKLPACTCNDLLYRRKTSDESVRIARGCCKVFKKTYLSDRQPQSQQYMTQNDSQNELESEQAQDDMPIETRQCNRCCGSCKAHLDAYLHGLSPKIEYSNIEVIQMGPKRRSSGKRAGGAHSVRDVRFSKQAMMVEPVRAEKKTVCVVM